MLAVKLSVEMPNTEQEHAEKLISKADQLCPYSKAIRGNVDVKVSVT